MSRSQLYRFPLVSIVGATLMVATTYSYSFGQTTRPASGPVQKPAAPAGVPKTAASTNAAGGKGPVANAQNSVAATVNGQPITRAELGRECLVRYGSQVLENILNKKLILQACEAQKIQITDKQVGAEIARNAEKYNLTPEVLQKSILEEKGISAEQYASDIIWPMLALRELAQDKIQVSQKDIDKVFDSEYGPKVQVRMIYVKDAQKANQIHQQAMADPSQFRRLAKQFSEDIDSASVEGLLPPIRRNSGDDLLERIAFDLKPNQISQIFSIADLHIMLQCVQHLPATPPPAQQIATIQKKIRDELSDSKLRETAATVFAALREQSKVVTVLGNAQLEQQNPGVAAFLNREPIPMALLTEECLKRHATQVLGGEINRKILEGALAKARTQVTQSDIDAEIARAAEYYGYPSVQEWLKNVLDEDGATMELYVRDAVWPTVALKKLVAGKVQVTNEDLQKGFESTYGPRAEVLAIVLSNPRTGNEVWQMARDVNTDKSFGELAAQYSVEPTSKNNFGKVTPLRRHGGQPKMEEIAFKLRPGEISPLVEISGQYVILRSQGFTEPIVKDDAAVKDILYKDILEKKNRIAMQDELDKLISSAQIDNYVEQKSQLGKAAVETARLPGADDKQPRR